MPMKSRRRGGDQIRRSRRCRRRWLSLRRQLGRTGRTNGRRRAKRCVRVDSLARSRLTPRASRRFHGCTAPSLGGTRKVAGALSPATTGWVTCSCTRGASRRAATDRCSRASASSSTSQCARPPSACCEPRVSSACARAAIERGPAGSEQGDGARRRRRAWTTPRQGWRRRGQRGGSGQKDGCARAPARPVTLVAAERDTAHPPPQEPKERPKPYTAFKPRALKRPAAAPAKKPAASSASATAPAPAPPAPVAPGAASDGAAKACE